MRRCRTPVAYLYPRVCGGQVSTPGNGERQGDGAAEEEGDVERDRALERQGKRKHIKPTSRLPKEVYQLYTDMVGYDKHNEAVTG